MILRNGIRSNLRARGRTILFTLLILAVTLSLSLGLGMWGYCGQMLRQCDENYTSIALVEYMGAEYPEEDTADPYARDAFGALDRAAISSVEGVELWETTDSTLASLEGYTRAQGELPYEQMGVVVVSVLSDPITQEQMVYLTPEELPEAYAANDLENGTLRIYSGDGEPEVLNCYFYEPSTGEYWQRKTELVEQGDITFGQTSEVPVSQDQLPSQYILMNASTGGMKVIYSGEADLYSLPTYYYDSFTDQIYDFEQVPVGFDGLMARSVYTLNGKDSGLLSITCGDTEFAPESGKYYLLHGTFYDSDLRGGDSFEVTEFYEGCDTPPWLELSGPEDPAVEEGIFADYAQRYRLGNNYIRLTASADVASLEVFQQNNLYLEEGRFPEAGEVGTCVLSGTTAASAGVAVGDTVTVSLLTSQEENRFNLSETGQVKELTVVGITNKSEDYDGCVWVSDAEGDFGGALYGYQLGRAVLDNQQARQAVEQLQALMPDQVRVTLYDQGYSAAAQPLETLRSTALAITLASGAGALAVLVLFAFLFVGRQRETVQILTSLGTPKGKITLWLLSGSGVIAGLAALLGGVTGALLLDRVITLALSAAQGLYQTDLRFSQAAVGLSCTLEQEHVFLIWPALCSVLAVFLLSLLLCALFLIQARRQDQPKRGKMKVRTPKAGTSVTGRGVLRFAGRNLCRGGLRSAVVPAAALVLALFLGLLGSTAQGWQRQMDTLYDSAVITGQATSLNGRYNSGLLIPGETVRLLNDTGLVKNLHISKGFHYWNPEEMPSFGEGSFSQESRDAWIEQQPELIALNGLDAAPEFFYADPQVEWLEGWDESMLASGDYRPFFESQQLFLGQAQEPECYPVLASRDYLTSHGLELGDSYTVDIRYEVGTQGTLEASIELQIVGSFQQHSTQANLYVPLAFLMDPEDLFGTENPYENLTVNSKMISQEDVADYFRDMIRFSTCRFELTSARNLEPLRNWLEQNEFGQVNGNRTTRTPILLQDATFTETVQSFGRYLSFGELLFPILLAVVAVLGFIISWLMVHTRRMEFAMLRGLGTPRGKVFLTFFLEQGVLCLLGCLAACGILALVGTGGLFQWLAVAGFAVCYLLGSALSVWLVGRIHLMSLLSERE